ncbi:CopG family antitoxin [Sorangium sp. So ce1182]|uniref:CopG family antitoxin n=1 Tax=Sorangium sp. So ce1182 TaxID=3133334 RepID=UPI003F63525C
MMAVKKSSIPSFGNDLEEREFWTQHSVEEFADELEELDVTIKPARSEQIAVRLYKEDLDALQELAKQKGVGHTTLARSVLEHWIARARGKAPMRPARPRTAEPRRKQPNDALQPTRPPPARRSRG